MQFFMINKNKIVVTNGLKSLEFEKKYSDNFNFFWILVFANNFFEVR
jgi:hypothetical protein